MKPLAIALYLFTVLLAGHIGLARAGEPAIVGAWIHVRGPAYFQEMAFTIENGERIFMSWLHHRPFVNGRWRLSDDRLVVEYHGKTRRVWTVVKADKQRLVLREEGLQELTVYGRAGEE